MGKRKRDGERKLNRGEARVKNAKMEGWGGENDDEGRLVPFSVLFMVVTSVSQDWPTLQLQQC
jgi:hypothetical protein